jgi:hypothetical protein
MAPLITGTWRYFRPKAQAHSPIALGKVLAMQTSHLLNGHHHWQPGTGPSPYQILQIQMALQQLPAQKEQR